MPEEEEKERYLSTADDEDTWFSVLDECTGILADEGIPYLAIGSIATCVLGYQEACSDIDLLVAPADAERALKALDKAGYDVEQTDGRWLFKAVKDRVLVDIIFRVGHDNEITPDDETFRRGKLSQLNGRDVRVVAPEDFLVMQAISSKQAAPEYWYKGLKAAAAEGLDWDYVVKRAEILPARVLSLLIYALSDGVEVPKKVLDELYASLEA